MFSRFLRLSMIYRSSGLIFLYTSFSKNKNIKIITMMDIMIATPRRIINIELSSVLFSLSPYLLLASCWDLIFNQKLFNPRIIFSWHGKTDKDNKKQKFSITDIGWDFNYYSNNIYPGFLCSCLFTLYGHNTSTFDNPTMAHCNIEHFFISRISDTTIISEENWLERIWLGERVLYFVIRGDVRNSIDDLFRIKIFCRCRS